MKKDKVKAFFSILFVCGILVSFFLSVWQYQSAAGRHLDNAAFSFLSRSAADQKEYLLSGLEDRFRQLRSLSAYAGEMLQEGRHNHIMELLEASVRSGEFEYLMAAAPDGSAYFSDGTARSISGESYFVQGLSGAEAVAEVSAPSEGALDIALAVPIFQNGTVVGVLGGFCRENMLCALLPGQDPSGCRAYLANRSGRIIAAGPGTDLPSDVAALLEGTVFEEDVSLPQILEHLSAEEPGNCRYRQGETQIYLSYLPLKESGWSLLYMIPGTYIEEWSAPLHRDILWLELKLAAGFLACWIFIGWHIWEKGQQLREEKMHLEWGEERYRILAKDSSECFFEYDYKTGAMTASENYQKVFGEKPVLSLEESVQIVHPDDQRAYQRLWQQMLRERRPLSMEVRIRPKDGGEYLWYSLYLSVLYDKKGSLRRIVGKMVDISRQKQKAAFFEEKARTDALTGLLNREGVEQSIRLCLDQREGGHALAIIDIDAFKKINDTFGHGVGDQVLQRAAQVIRSAFRTSDIVGRLGGDEFMVLVRRITSWQDLQPGILRLQKQLAEASAELPCPVTFSIGIALHPSQGESFHELYRSADIALYEAKRQGKNRCAFYQEQMGPRSELEILNRKAHNCYIINPKTHQLLFINDYIRRRMPNVKPGDFCYREFMNRETPCENCPAKGWEPSQGTHQCDFYNPHFQEWVQTTVSEFCWEDGQPAVRMDCSGIPHPGGAELPAEAPRP